MSPTTPTGPGVPGSPSDLEPARPDHPLARLLGGFAEPLRPDDLLSLDQPPKTLRPLRRWRYNAGIRLLVFLASVLVAALLIGGTAGLGWTVAFPGRPFPTASPLVNALAIPAFVLAYLALVWWWEKRRPPFELTLRRAGGLLYGLAWGVGLQLLCVGTDDRHLDRAHPPHRQFDAGDAAQPFPELLFQLLLREPALRPRHQLCVEKRRVAAVGGADARVDLLDLRKLAQRLFGLSDFRFRVRQTRSHRRG